MTYYRAKGEAFCFILNVCEYVHTCVYARWHVLQDHVHEAGGGIGISLNCS